MELLKDEKAKCYKIGTWLKLRPSTLELIRAESPDHTTAMVEIILNWLRGSYNTEMFGPPTWKMLAEAVRAPTGGNNTALAKMIASQAWFLLPLLFCFCFSAGLHTLLTVISHFLLNYIYRILFASPWMHDQLGRSKSFRLYVWRFLWWCRLMKVTYWPQEPLYPHEVPIELSYTGLQSCCCHHCMFDAITAWAMHTPCTMHPL